MFKQIQVIGHLGKDPVIRQMSNGGWAANMSVACNESYKDKEGLTVNKVMWFDLVAYQTGERGLVTALIQPHLRQGQLVFVSGEPVIRPYIDRDGNQRKAFEIKLGPQSTIRMLGGKPNGEKATANGHDPETGEIKPQGTAAGEPPPRTGDDELPPF